MTIYPGISADVVLKQCLVKLFHFGHIHINAEQAFDFAFFIQYPVSEGADMAKFIIIKLPSGLQVSLIIYIGIVADILRISLSLY